MQEAEDGDMEEAIVKIVVTQGEEGEGGTFHPVLRKRNGYEANSRKTTKHKTKRVKRKKVKRKRPLKNRLI